MKDYTKYNFAAIVGAKVEIEPKEGHPYKGALVMSTKTTIVIQDSVTGLWRPLLKECIASLSAKIKVEDMSVKQLKKAFNLGTYEVLVFNEATGTIANRDVDGGELGHTYEELPFNDYIDCTDWGWKE